MTDEDDDCGQIPWDAEHLTNAAGVFLGVEKQKGAALAERELFMWLRETYDFNIAMVHWNRFMTARDLINKNLPRLVKEELASVTEQGGYELTWSLMQALATLPFTHQVRNDFYLFELEEVVGEAKRLDLNPSPDAPPA